MSVMSVDVRFDRAYYYFASAAPEFKLLGKHLTLIGVSNCNLSALNAHAGSKTLHQ